jgi:TonB family protein
LQNTNAQTAVDTNASIKNAIRTVDIEAQFPGGMTEFSRFLGDNIRYPKKAQDEGVEGKVIVEFVVCEDGQVCNINIKQNPSVILTNEAIRVLKSMPQWKPATQDGKKVSMYYSLPISFSLENEPRKKRWWGK